MLKPCRQNIGGLARLARGANLLPPFLQRAEILRPEEVGEVDKIRVAHRADQVLPARQPEPRAARAANPVPDPSGSLSCFRLTLTLQQREIKVSQPDESKRAGRGKMPVERSSLGNSFGSARLVAKLDARCDNRHVTGSALRPPGEACL